MFSTIASAPAKQSVGETITVLSGRLNSATLLEDRRAAILGLRSFAKEYPASVASGALKNLIGSLSKDGEDVDTVKVVLETLLMLFTPNPDSPEASEDISLWLADEFTQRQENVALLLDFLETNDFYSRLYSLQLLSAILSARTERTEECIFAAPLGLSRLVAVLDDRREAVRNEAVTLLTWLTPTSPDIQKIVAFEGAFEKVFDIIAAEGGLVDGDRIVEDCLILLANLLRLNALNQSHFRETGCVPHLSKLLKNTYEPGKEEVADWAQNQGNRNIYALLAVLRLFLVHGASGTLQNQAAFWQHLILYHALQLAFSQATDLSIRAEALATCADVIRDNPKLQENFAQLQVPSVIPVDTNGINGKTNGISVTLVYVIDGLLDLTLGVASLQMFDLRIAACDCLKAYFHGHPEIRLHFLHRAIEGHGSGRDETSNVLTTLLQPSGAASPSSSDPYRHWFASVILLNLLYDNDDTKGLAMSVTEGDADSGEEVVTSIQTITAHLLSGLARGTDNRILVGYLMLLIGWLFNNPDGVNDFLSEGSNLQPLIGKVERPGDVLVSGLCAFLLGVIYEFSTKDSPIPRSALHDVLMTRMKREKYQDAIRKLRTHPSMRDFEVTPQKADDSGELPEVYFDDTFVDCFKENCRRITRAIDSDPGLEVSVVVNGEQKGISREMVDTLRAEKEESYHNWQSALIENTTLSQQLGQVQADLARIKNVNDALQRNHDDDVTKLRRENEELKRIFAESERQKVDVERKFEETQRKYGETLRSLQRQEEEAAKTLKQKEAEWKSAEASLRQEIETRQREAQKQLDAQRQEAQKALDTQRQEAQKALDAQRHEAQKVLETANTESTAKAEELQRQVDYIKKTAEAEAARIQRRTGAEMADLRATISRQEVDLMKANKAHSQELESAKKETAAAATKLKEAEALVQDLKAQLKEAKDQAQKSEAQLESRVQELERQLEDQVHGLGAEKDAEIKKIKAQLEEKEADIKKKDEEKAATQTELDDLLMVFGDLEEKAEKYKKQVQELGGTVSEAEDDDEDDDDDDDDDGEVD